MTDHSRNTEPMRASPRCGAKTRGGTPCRAPAVSGKRRCRMHGGAAGSGAPKGNQNALKSGLYTREMIEMRRKLAQLMREARQTLRDLS
ncbi:HGGxSTG domain-containing protein [Tsuneonella sp. SYSU-LHT278]|uniref:HGGxSTG domain-containing protein n=1 Tax=Tsuneonella sediminis TaxID=3416089 RepID=UPI003F7A79EE